MAPINFNKPYTPEEERIIRASLGLVDPWPGDRIIQGDFALQYWMRDGWGVVRDKLWTYYENKAALGLEATPRLNARMKQGVGYNKTPANCLSFAMQLPVIGTEIVQPHIVAQFDFKKPESQWVLEQGDVNSKILDTVATLEILCETMEKTGLFHRDPKPGTEPVLVMSNKEDYHFMRVGQLDPVTHTLDLIDKNGHEGEIIHTPNMNRFFDIDYYRIGQSGFHKKIAVLFYEGLPFDWKIETDKRTPENLYRSYHLTL